MSRHTEQVRLKVTVVTDAGPSVASPSVARTVMVLRGRVGEREGGRGRGEQKLWN